MKPIRVSHQDSSGSPAWYVLRTYPGLEQKVKTNLENHLREKIPDTFLNIVIPMEEQDQPALSGFLLIKMAMDAKVWNVVRNIPGITGFVGMGNTPTRFDAPDWKQIPLQRFAN